MTSFQRTGLALLGGVAAMFVGSVDASADTWNVDPAHSAVMFRVKHFGVAYTWGRFRKISGSVTTDKRASKSSVSLEIATNSIYTNWRKRDGHLKSPDFFNAKLYPKISFTSTRVRKAGKRWTVTGKLAMHGKTRTVTVRMKQIGTKTMMGKTRTGFSGKLTVKRSKFGMSKLIKEGVAGDAVELFIDIEVVKQ